MLVYRKSLGGDLTFFLYKKFFLFQEMCIAADHMSENDL